MGNMRGTHTALAGVVLVLLCALASAADPKAELERKQKEKAAARAAPAQITAGELEDLEAEVRRLANENAALKQKLDPAAAGKPQAKRWTTIEVGMTRAELITFIKQHPREYRIGDFSTEAGGVDSDKEEVIQSRVRSGTSGTTVTQGTPPQRGVPRSGTSDGGRTQDIEQQSAEEEARVTERRRARSKRERVTIDVMGYKRAVVGTERNIRGTYDKYGRVKAVVGQLNVELVEDVVTAVRHNRFGS